MMSAAGVSLSTPAAIGSMNPEYMEYAPTATAQVLTIVVVTSILIPIIVKNIVKINYKNIVRFFEESNDIFLTIKCVCTIVMNRFKKS